MRSQAPLDHGNASTHIAGCLLCHRFITIQRDHRLLRAIEAFAGGADVGVVFTRPVE